jgi:hypothetical protein
LVLACKDKAFNIVMGTKNKDAHAAWIRIRHVMAPKKAKDLIKLNKQFTSLKMEDDSEDPELYSMELEKFNELYQSVAQERRCGHDCPDHFDIATFMLHNSPSPGETKACAGGVSVQHQWMVYAGSTVLLSNVIHQWAMTFAQIR